MKTIWKQVLTPGYGRAINPPRKIVVREQEVEVLGPVNFEPSMLRVRLADGTVHRAMRDDLKEMS